MKLEFQEIKRNYELIQVLPLFPPGSNVLEIGAGAGWQAKAMAEKGVQIVAIDIPGSAYKNQRVWPVIEYDGENLPFPDKHFDIVFSSNVMEHIPQVEQFQAEIQRVLKPGGKAIHLMPTSTWRISTILSFYIDRPIRLWRMIIRKNNRRPGYPDNLTKPGIDPSHKGSKSETKPRELTGSRILKRLSKELLPSRHGAQGNFLSEIYLFSGFRWKKVFKENGWHLESHSFNHLFYTGHSVLNTWLSLETRARLSQVLGSSCHIFYLTKPRPGPETEPE